MKNKVLILALLVLFVSVSFMGCGGDSPKIVKEVKVDKITGGYILTWDAVGKNVTDYMVFAKLEDTSSIFPMTQGSNTKKWDGSKFVKNDDADKWTAYIDDEDGPVTGSKSYFFGVRTLSTMDDYSNIRWSKEKYALTN
jgi:hypothetical protein